MKNGSMITLARELNGITQTVLSSNIPNLTQSTLSQLELGLLDVNSEIWKSIADYFNLPESFFSLQRPRRPVASFYYRRRQIMPKKQLSTLEATVDLLRITVDKLLDIVDIPEFCLPNIDIAEQVDKKNASEIAARKIRGLLKINKGPIINIIEILEKNGIIVYFLKHTHEKFDGITMYSDKGQPIIFINDGMPNDRKRFTLAHELGHLILHLNSFQDIDRDEEMEANNFASEFLMPGIEIAGMLNYLNLNKIASLKTYWHVSKSALIRRAYELGIIERNKYSYFNIELSRRGEKKYEKGEVFIDSPKIFRQIIQMLKADLHYGSEEIRNLLCLPKNFYESHIESGKLHIVY